MGMVMFSFIASSSAVFVPISFLVYMVGLFGGRIAGCE